jgi:hypothetical protein
MAVFVPQVQKTFFVYCGTAEADISHLQIMISYFDHTRHVVPRPVIVFDKMGVNDPQDNASLAVTPDGFIWVFISGRGRTRPGYIFKSDNPYSIESFSEIMSGEIVFPQAWWIDSSFVMMHSRIRRGRELYWCTSSDGKRWSTPAKLAGMGGHFQVTNLLGNKLYSAFSYTPGGNLDGRTNLYLVYTDDYGKSWRNVDGKEVETPLIDTLCSALVHDFRAEGKLVYINDLNFDSQGNPVILAIISDDFRPGPEANRELTVIHRKDGKWIFSKVCSMHHNYNLGSIYISEKEWRIISPSEPGPAEGTGGEIVLWKSRDEGLSWEKSAMVTSNSTYNNSYIRRPFNPHDGFYSFWADGDPVNRSESRLYFTNKKCDRVWVLPYRMKKDFEVPKRVK